MDIITCNHITVHNERTLALSDVSFSLRRGEFLTIVGENGAGKSTLIRALLGIIPVDSGEIVTAPGIAGKIGYLPQQSSAQHDFPASVREVVMSGNIGSTKLFPFYTRTQKIRAEANMALLGITPLAAKSYRALSGGQQQRVLLARALCAAEQVLLLDEPTAGLDPMVTHELYTVVRHLCTEHNMAILMISHDFAAAMKYSDRILHLATSVRFIGTPQEYAKTPLAAAFGARDAGDE